MIIEPCLGSGAYGSVSLVRDVNSRIYYARKTVTALYSIRLVN
jgi:aurora kinase A